MSERMDPLQVAMPFAAMLGVEVLAASTNEVRGRLAWAPERCTAAGILHGGLPLLSLRPVISPRRSHGPWNSNRRVTPTLRLAAQKNHCES